MTVMQLWTKNRKLAITLSRMYGLPGGEEQDLEQEALIALWIAARSWDPEDGTPFEPFATICVKRRLHSVLKAALRGKHKFLNESVREVRDEHGDWVSILDTIADNRDTLAVVIDRERFLRVISAVTDLPPYQRRAVEQHLEGLPSSSSKAHDNALTRAREFLRSAA